jgi:hypothetical protein
MYSKIKKGHPIRIIHQDNAGENKKLVTLAHSMEWKLSTVFKKKITKDSSAEFKN